VPKERHRIGELSWQVFQIRIDWNKEANSAIGSLIPIIWYPGK